ncbi:MAG: 4Fe-4S dicluster domain-containing protein [Promethearchaeota archaeon]
MEIGKQYKVTKKTELAPVESLLKTMLEKNMVDAVLGASAPKSIDQLKPITIENPDDVKNMFIDDSYLAVDFAKTDSASKYIHKSMNGALQSKVGAFGRACDVRALVELHKRRQVNLDNIIMIGFEEYGRLDPKLMKKFYKTNNIDVTKLSSVKLTGEKVIINVDGEEKEFTLDDKINIAHNCSNCSRKAVINADVKVNALTSDLIMTPLSQKGLVLLEQANDLLEFTEVNIDLDSKISELEAKGREKQLKEIEEFRKKSTEEKIKALGKCTMCGMCIRSCPVCFCVDCILQKKRKEKNINQFTYQLTRISHVADTCVQCGRCDTICPVNLPLNIYFNDIANKLEEQFNYVTGRSIEDIPPRANVEDLQMRFKKH